MQKINLTAKLTYKPWISAFLLCVYAFIATPVQFWHHHKDPGSISVSDSKQEKTISKSDSKKVEAGCQICSHHYSAYTDDASPVFVIAAPNEGIKEVFSLQAIPTAHFFNLSGRGPPSI